MYKGSVTFLWLSPSDQIDHTIKRQPAQDKFSASAHVEVSLTWRLTGFFYFKNLELAK